VPLKAGKTDTDYPYLSIKFIISPHFFYTFSLVDRYTIQNYIHIIQHMNNEVP